MSEDNKNNTFHDGMIVRREVLGDDHVNNAIQNTTELDKKFQKYITEGAWGTVWTGDNLSKRERSLITISLLAALGHHEELEMHINASKNTGAKFDEISDALMHVAVYAGVPASNSAIKILKKIYKESEKNTNGK